MIKPIEPLPYSFADAIAHDWQQNPNRYVVRGSNVTNIGALSQQLAYLEGFPEAQKAARQAFVARLQKVEQAEKSGALTGRRK